MTLDKTTKLKQQNQNVYSYLFVSSYLNQGLIYYMKTKMHFQKKQKNKTKQKKYSYMKSQRDKIIERKGKMAKDMQNGKF